MFRHVAAFEWRYQVKSPVFWVGCLIFFFLAFGAATNSQIQIGSRGSVNINSPFAILQTLAIMTIFGVFIVVAMVSNVVIRDDDTGFAPILRSTRIGKGSYLVGRFVGATAAALLVLACVPLAIALGSVMPWQDAEKIGAFRWSYYLWPLFAFALPTLLITAASFFALATATRSMMWTYVGAVGFLMLYLVMRTMLRDPRHDTLSALLDPFGLSALSIATKYWTATERNTQLPELSGLLLANRLLWTGVAAALFALAWRLFSFETRNRAGAATALEAPAPDPKVDLATLPMPRTDAATRRAQWWALTRHDMGFVFRSPAFFVLLGIGLVNAAGSLWFSGELYGSPSYPVTRLMVEALNGAFTIMPIIIAIFYGGELVWRDRDRRVHEIVDATAAPDWVHLVPKIVAISLVLFCTAMVGMLAGVLVQLLKGFHQFQLGAYLLWFVLPTTLFAVLLAVLSVFVQVLVPQKFIGWGVMLVYLVGTVALNSAGFEHNLYNYGGTTPTPLSDMNGMGRFWIGAAWLQAYWLAFATMLAVLSYGLWRRGAATALRPRLGQLRQRLKGPAMALLAFATAAWLGLGGWVFYNTNVLGTYLTQDDVEQRQAEAEKALLAFEKLPRPQITAVTLAVQLYPKDARAVTTGSYALVNRTALPLTEVHVQLDPSAKLDRVEFDGGARVQREWKPFNYRVYQLDQPMQPGERRLMRFTTTLAERGFSNSRPLTRIVENGSFLNNFEIAPTLGIFRDGLLKDRSKRRKYGLPPDLRPPTLEDESGRAFATFGRDSAWVTADITITTDTDQTPIAPGQTISDVVKDGRRTARFKTDAPIENFFSVQSARYAVKTDTWKGPKGDVALAVYHHPEHAYNVERMLSAMKVSLALFNEQFSPYQFGQARILEFPSYASFAQSFANTIPYSESIGFLHRWGDPEKIDMVTYVTAHEIGHQWWGHQLVPSEQQGATMLVESFAQYSALLVMERLYGPEQIRRFLKYELDRYLRDRGSEVVEELPLARVENQPYIHYRKGSLVMFWLKEMVGEDKVNRSMARLLQKYAFKGAPYPNTRDFLALLREEAGPQHDALIADLFEKITLLDMKALNASTVQRSDGRWDVSFDVSARKLYADGKGKETEASMDEAVDIGVFADEPGTREFKAASVLHFERRAIRSGTQTVKLVVDKLPRWVGVDPYNKRIDRNSSDNLSAVDKP